MGSITGLLCTGSMLLVSTGWRLKRVPRVVDITASPIGVFRSETSLK
jgi:hypothetical protein